MSEEHGSFPEALSNLLDGLRKSSSSESRVLLRQWDVDRGTDWYTSTRRGGATVGGVVDQTFHRTLVSCGRTVYAHPEHGGPTDEPLRADLTSNVDQSLGKTMTFARETHPQYEWVYSRLLVQVVPFEPQQMIVSLIRDRVRAQGLAKLTPEEREALGL